MKKSLAALAVLSAFAGASFAANVTLYGVVDEGLSFSSVRTDGADRVNKLELASGIQSGSRWGIKGSEDLGNGLSANFILESGFNVDAGTLAQGDNVLFGRQSVLFLQGSFGQFGGGRLGGPLTGSGSMIDKLGGITALSSSWGAYFADVNRFATVDASRANNALFYVSPKTAGLQATAYYSMSVADGTENKASSNRLAQIAVSYDAGAFNALLGASRMIYGHDAGADVDDSLSITAGASYDFGVAKVYLGGQYFDEVTTTTLGDVSTTAPEEALTKLKMTGYGLSLSASTPVAGGKLAAAVDYVDASEADSSATKFDFTRWTVSATYDYPLSKRTNLYAGASYGTDNYEYSQKDIDTDYYRVFAGIRHKF